MEKKLDKIMKYVFLLTAITSIIAVLLICLFLFGNGLPAISKIGFIDFIFGKEWSPTDIPAAYGILPMILGSIFVTFGAVLIGVPIGVLSAVFLAELCPKPLYAIIHPLIQLLAGIPSVIYGFFGMSVLVPFVRNISGGDGNSIVTASILLGIMILPTIITVSESAIFQVPKTYYEGALALGSSDIRSIFFVTLPAASNGIFSAIILGIGRAIGETMAVIMVAGNQARMPKSIFHGIRTMTANIALEMGYAADLHREALIATGVILFIFVLLINTLFLGIKRKEKK